MHFKFETIPSRSKSSTHTPLCHRQTSICSNATQEGDTHSKAQTCYWRCKTWHRFQAPQEQPRTHNSLQARPKRVSVFSRQGSHQVQWSRSRDPTQGSRESWSLEIVHPGLCNSQSLDTSDGRISKNSQKSRKFFGLPHLRLCVESLHRVVATFF